MNERTNELSTELTKLRYFNHGDLAVLTSSKIVSL